MIRVASLRNTAQLAEQEERHEEWIPFCTLHGRKKEKKKWEGFFSVLIEPMASRAVARLFSQPKPRFARSVMHVWRIEFHWDCEGIFWKNSFPAAWAYVRAPLSLSLFTSVMFCVQLRKQFLKKIGSNNTHVCTMGTQTGIVLCVLRDRCTEEEISKSNHQGCQRETSDCLGCHKPPPTRTIQNRTRSVGGAAVFYRTVCY